MIASDAREVLIAELLGDTGGLLDRIDAVMPKLEAGAARLEHVSAKLPESTEQALQRVYGFVGKAADEAAKHAVEVTNKNADKVFVAQTAVLRATAKEIFDKEITPPLHQLTRQLHAAIRQSREDPWNRWLTHAATAAVAMFLPIVLPLLISLASPSPAKASSTAPVPECALPGSAPTVVAEPAPGSAPPSSKARVRK